VPYLSVPSDIATGYHQRTRLMGFRMVVLTLGILIGGAVAPLLANQETGTRGDYLTMSIVLGAVMLLTMLAGITGVRRLEHEVPPSPTGDEAAHRLTLRERFAVAWSNRPFFWLMCSYLVMSTTTHLLLAGTPFFTEFVMDNAKLTTVLFACFVAPALVATPLWAKISRRYGKQRLLLLSQGMFVVGSLLLLLGRPGGLAYVLPSMLLLGIAFAGMQLFPFSMLPDTVKSAGESGQRNAGAFTGLWTATEATGAALGPYLYAGALAIGGFISTQAGETVVQSASAVTAVRLAFSLLPAGLMVIAVLLQRRYSLDDART
jgi:Na+/melibiose symporter-like transporter